MWGISRAITFFARASSAGFMTKMAGHLSNAFVAIVSDREIMRRPLRGSQTLFVMCPKRVPEPAARITTAGRIRL